MKNSNYESKWRSNISTSIFRHLSEIKSDILLSTMLDLLRAIGAVLVLVGHVRNLLLVDYQNIDQPSLLATILYLISGYGHQAVVIFFVLSGLLIGNSVFRSFQAFNFSWREYLISRLNRLWIVLIPALCIGGIIDIVGSKSGLFPSISLYIQSNGTNAIHYPVSDYLTSQIFFGNLFFLSSIWVPTYGSNTPLWTLSHEFWYYLFLPGLLSIIFSSGKIRYLYGLLLLLITLAGNLYQDIGLLIWLMGAAINIIPASKKKNLLSQTSLELTLVTGAIAFVALLGSRYVSFIYYDLILGLLISLFLWSLKNSKQDVNSVFKSICQHWAGFSYSLYVCHLPLTLFICSFLSFPNRLQPTSLNLSLLILLLMFILLYSYIFAQLTERHTSIIRKKISSLIKV
jgi:peptidoglycan/LPS O-acetylase OafA/YrhL